MSLTRENELGLLSEDTHLRILLSPEGLIFPLFLLPIKQPLRFELFQSDWYSKNLCPPAKCDFKNLSLTVELYTASSTSFALKSVETNTEKAKERVIRAAKARATRSVGISYKNIQAQKGQKFVARTIGGLAGHYAGRSLPRFT